MHSKEKQRFIKIAIFVGIQQVYWGTVDVHSFTTIKMIKHIPRKSSNENIFWLVLVITNASIAGVHKIQRSYGQIGYNRRESLQRLDYFQTKEWVRAFRLIYEINPRDS